MKKFIVFDGLDGCGKDTQVNLIAQVYEQQEERLMLGLTHAMTINLAVNQNRLF